jgi:uncharacterized membrane protein (UPF0127 family)
MSSTATQTTDLRIYVESTGALVGDSIRYSGSSSERRQGLLHDNGLDAGSGMLIVPCEGVHTFGMRFPIDVVFLDKSYRIIRTSEAVPPWRIRLCLRAHSTLELPAGVIRSLRLRRGLALRVERASN